jgi:putative ABC transport system permease protein
MNLWRRWFSRKTKWEQELSEELRFHIEQQTATNVAAGMPPEEARRQATLQLGGAEGVKAYCREERRGFWLESVWMDVRYAARVLRKSPGFTAVAVLTLALGIGGTSSVFSVVDRILFRSLPYPHAERLVSFGLTAPIERNEFMLGSNYVDWRVAPGPFESVTSMVPGTADCDLTEHNPARLACAHVEQNFLSTLGIQPIAGRNLSPDEDRPGAPLVALISYSLWRSRFGGDPGVLSKSISLDGHPVTIVGVLPADFEMPNLASVDILLPEALDVAAQRRSSPGAVLRAFARLKPGITVAQSAAAVQPLFAQALQAAPPEFRNEVRLSVRSLRDRQIQDARLASWVLLGAVFAVLLVACTNVANLLLARASTRQRELALRAALGASPARLLRQRLTESVLLGVLGGAAGCWVAYLFLRVFIAIAPQGIPRLSQAGVDWRVVFFTFSISCLSGFLFGLTPALHAPSPEMLCGKEVRAASRCLLRETLVAVQIAVSLTLLTGAGLLLRSLANLQSAPLGLQPQSVLIENISLGVYRYPDSPQQLEFFDELLARLRPLPGVSAVALSDTLPPSGGMRSTIYAGIEIPGRPRFAEGTGGMVGWRAVTPEYFAALGIPLVRGRAFTNVDQTPSQNSIILSDSLARRLFPSEDPLGKTMRFGLAGPWRTVIAVAGNVKNNGIEEPSDPEFYIPWKNEDNQSFRSAHLILRTPLDPRNMSQWLRSETSALDPSLPVAIETMPQRVGQLAQRPRFNAALLSLFAAMGVLLAAIGIYGVVGFLVAQRTQEIGVRMALGATPHAILLLMLGRVARWTLAGGIIGLLGSWFTSRLLQALLFQVPVHDPLPVAAALAVEFAVAFLAAWIPARRAMRVDPMVALRYE